ncbi:MAG: glycosyltransferase family 2 protein [Thermodesulfobacteriota bacterium]|nr:glycosyltransferase family 2 protein [Thermodesulfobacteriota bacterium]
MLIILLINFVILALVVWNSFAWPLLSATGNHFSQSCSILIPARNEEDNIGECLDSVLRQGNSVSEIIVCNDHSEDATAAIVSHYQKKDYRIRMIATGNLPKGWCGKSFACNSLAAEAHGDWMLFIDADTRLSSDAVNGMIAEAVRQNYTFLSSWPGLVMESAWERVLMPMLNFVVFTLFPAPLSFRRDDPSLGLAHGACILVKRTEYNAIGGHELVFNRIFEDTSLARAWRASGRKGICLDGQDLVRVRMYNSLEGIWQGFQKNIYPAFSRGLSFWIFLVFHTTCFLIPFIILPWIFLGYWHLWPLGISALCVILMRIFQAGRFRFPLWSVLFHPLAEVMLIAIGLSSWSNCQLGRGVSWKGRVYKRGIHHD